MPIKDLIDRKKWTIIMWWRVRTPPSPGCPDSFRGVPASLLPPHPPHLRAPPEHLKEVSTWPPWACPPASLDLTFLPPFLLLAIGTAYAVLSNPEKRKQYDQFGDDKGQAARHGHGHADFHRGFEADISPEDLFNMFFGGGFPSSKFPCSPPRPGLPGGDGGRWDASLAPLPSSPTPDSVPLTPR